MANEEDDTAAKVAAIMRQLLPQITQLVIADSPRPPPPTDARMPNASPPHSEHHHPPITPSPHLPYHHDSPTPSIPNLTFNDTSSFDAPTPIHTLNQTADPSPAITELRTQLEQVTLPSPYYPPHGPLPVVPQPAPYHRPAGHLLPKIVWPTRSVITPIRFIHKRQERTFHYTTIVEGFPHPFTRKSFFSKDRATQGSRYLYYAVLYGHERGIFRTWAGCWARIADYPGAEYKATNNYDAAMAYIRLSDESTHYQVVRRFCAPAKHHQELSPSASDLPAPPSYPHPAQPARQQNLHAASESSSSSRSSADDQSIYHAPVDIYRPVHSITLSHTDIVSPSSRSVASSQSYAASRADIAAQFADQFAEARLQEKTTTELDTKFQKFHDPKNWSWWIAQLLARGLHPAWRGCFSSLGTTPLVTTSNTVDLSQRLYQRLVDAINEKTGLILMGRHQEFQGKGLELLQALYDQYQPNDVVTLPLVFTDWSQLAQQADEESLKFSGRVRELALRSKNSGQPYTEASQCLAFLRGLNSNFNHFSQDYFSGRSDIRLTTLATITSQTQSLERTFSSKGKTKTFGSSSAPVPTAPVPPKSSPLHPLSEATLDSFVKKNKCPIHRMDNHTLAECGFLKRHGFHCVPTGTTPLVSAGNGRHVSFPPATRPPVQSPAPAAPQPTPASAPAPPHAIGRATYASALSSFPPALSDDDDISVEYDFLGSDSSPNTTNDATTSYYAPRFVDEEKCPDQFIVPPPTPPSRGLLPSWLLRPLLFLICAYSTCHQSLNSNTPLLPTRRTVRQAVQSYVFPSPSVCVGTASMAQPQHGNSSIGRILCALQPPATHACIDSGASCDMCPIKEFFEDYIPNTDNNHITVADRRRIHVAGRGTLRIILGGHPVRLRNCLHVPDLDMFLLSTRIHRRRGQGCAFIADPTGCFLTFPSFIIPIDDTLECLVPCSAAPPSSTFDYDETTTLTYPAAPIITRRSAKRAFYCRTWHHNGSARLVTRSFDYGTLVPELLPDPVQKVIPIPFLPSSIDTTNIPPTVRTSELPLSSAPATVRYSPQELHVLLGNRTLPDYSVLESIGTGIKVVDVSEPILSVGDVVNIKRGRKGKSLQRPRKALDVVGMDIGYGDGTSPGGFKYTLLLVDRTTRKTWVYGLRDMTGSTIADAIWSFFIDAGGIPRRIQCDFDPRFLGGKVRRLLTTRGIRVTASPPNRQSQNGLVESHWKTATQMARSFLAEAHLPKSFWFWALRESVARMNLIPVRFNDNPSDLTTPHELYYGTPPDYRVLFPFGALGYYHRPQDGGRGNRTTFESQAFTGIALGRSDNANGLMFWNPTLQRFAVSADYRLDSARSLQSAFPELKYDGGLTLRLYSDPTQDYIEVFPVGLSVFARLPSDTPNEFNFVEGTVIACPGAKPESEPLYKVRLSDTDTGIFSRIELFHPDDPLGPDSLRPPTSASDLDEDEADPLIPVLPTWMKIGTKLTLLIKDRQYKGFLDLDTDNDWLFTVRGRQGQLVLEHPLVALEYSWRDRIIDGSMQLGHQELKPDHLTARHVSANGLLQSCPGSLRKALDSSNPDRHTWLASYTEEYNGLVALDTFTTINRADLAASDFVGKPMPTMCVLTIKTDEFHNPVRAKSRIVVLGNLESRMWTTAECYAPVLRQDSLRLLTSIAVENQCVLKQGDCKNAFCQPHLPIDEVVIVAPPAGCPISTPGTLWRLNKTLYGLRRSPRHWYEKFRDTLFTMGFTQCVHDPCIFYCTPFPGGSRLYLGMYVDDFVYFSTCPQSELWFETTLESHLKVDFMGRVTWFLGIYFEWTVTSDAVGVHLSQEGYISELLRQNQMEQCNGTATPYRSGLVIDRLPTPAPGSLPDPALTKEYQKLMGSYVWLNTSTRPDLCVVLKLL